MTYHSGVGRKYTDYVRATNGATSTSGFTSTIPTWSSSYDTKLIYEIFVNQLVIRHKASVGITNMKILFAESRPD